ncbi:hypothetical protein D3C81_1868960 [compost metagenome]
MRLPLKWRSPLPTCSVPAMRDRMSSGTVSSGRRATNSGIGNPVWPIRVSTSRASSASATTAATLVKSVLARSIIG